MIYLLRQLPADAGGQRIGIVEQAPAETGVKFRVRRGTAEVYAVANRAPATERVVRSYSCSAAGLQLASCDLASLQRRPVSTATEAVRAFMALAS